MAKNQFYRKTQNFLFFNRVCNMSCQNLQAVHLQIEPQMWCILAKTKTSQRRHHLQWAHLVWTMPSWSYPLWKIYGGSQWYPKAVIPLHQPLHPCNWYDTPQQKRLWSMPYLHCEFPQEWVHDQKLCCEVFRCQKTPNLWKPCFSPGPKKTKTGWKCPHCTANNPWECRAWRNVRWWWCPDQSAGGHWKTHHWTSTGTAGSCSSNCTQQCSRKQWKCSGPHHQKCCHHQ